MSKDSSSVDQVTSEGYLPIGHKFDKDPPLGTFGQRCVKQVSPEKPFAQGQTPSTSTGEKSLAAREISQKALECDAHNEALERCSRSVGFVLGALHLCGSQPKRGTRLLKRASKAHQNVLPDVLEENREELISRRVQMKLNQLGLKELRKITKGTCDLGYKRYELNPEYRSIIDAVEAAAGRFQKAAAAKVTRKAKELRACVKGMCEAATKGPAALQDAIDEAHGAVTTVLDSCRLRPDAPWRLDEARDNMLKRAMAEYINDKALLPYDRRKLAPPGTPVVTPKVRQALINTLSIENSVLEQVKKDSKDPYIPCEESVLELKTLLAKLPKRTLSHLSSGRTSFPREAFLGDKGAGKIFKAKYKLLEWLIDEELKEREVS